MSQQGKQKQKYSTHVNHCVRSITLPLVTFPAPETIVLKAYVHPPDREQCPASVMLLHALLWVRTWMGWAATKHTRSRRCPKPSELGGPTHSPPLPSTGHCDDNNILVGNWSFQVPRAATDAVPIPSHMPPVCPLAWHWYDGSSSSCWSVRLAMARRRISARLL